jgi:hypothetical protein
MKRHKLSQNRPSSSLYRFESENKLKSLLSSIDIVTLIFVHSQMSPVLYFTARPEQGRGITEIKFTFVNIKKFMTLVTRF